MSVRLVPPDGTYSGQIAAYRRDMLAAGSSMDGTGCLSRTEDPEEWIAFCEKLRNRETTPAGWVPSTQFLAVDEDGRVVGMLDVRHVRNSFLDAYGGNIGYSVLPRERRKGYAAEMLRQALDYCWRERQMDRVLITCLEDNEASRRTILKNGGQLESTVVEPVSGKRLQRYWIERPLVFSSEFV